MMLKPCPFCGSDKIINDSTGCSEIRGSTYQTEWIECKGYGASIEDEVVDGIRTNDVFERWNKRV
jgi:Lar family restriction alleviation protein